MLFVWAWTPASSFLLLVGDHRVQLIVRFYTLQLIHRRFLKLDPLEIELEELAVVLLQFDVVVVLHFIGKAKVLVRQYRGLLLLYILFQLPGPLFQFGHLFVHELELLLALVLLHMELMLQFFFSLKHLAEELLRVKGLLLFGLFFLLHNVWRFSLTEV